MAVKPQLLIVDDDPNTRDLLLEALEVYGANVRVSSNASEARQAVTAWHPDLMISDLGMPREDGYQLIRRVRNLPADQGGTIPATLRMTNSSPGRAWNIVAGSARESLQAMTSVSGLWPLASCA